MLLLLLLHLPNAIAASTVIAACHFLFISKLTDRVGDCFRIYSLWLLSFIDFVQLANTERVQAPERASTHRSLRSYRNLRRHTPSKSHYRSGTSRRSGHEAFHTCPALRPASSALPRSALSVL